MTQMAAEDVTVDDRPQSAMASETGKAATS